MFFAVKYFFDIIVRPFDLRIEIEFLLYVIDPAAAHRLADLRRPVIVPLLAPWIDLLKNLKLPFFEGGQPYLYFRY